MDLMGPLPGDTNGRFNKPLLAALRGSAIGYAAGSKTLNEQVARVLFDGLRQGVVLDDYAQSGRHEKVKIADNLRCAGGGFHASQRTL